MTVDSLHTSEIDLNLLNQFMDELYAEEPKPRLSNINAAQQFVTVSQEGNLLGFLAVYENEEYPMYLTVGNFESINDSAVVGLLFSEVRKIAIKLRCTALIGPLNGNTWFSYRFSRLQQHPFFMETIHQPYYLDLWKGAGFTEWEHYQTNIEKFTTNKQLPDVQTFLSKNNLSIRNFDSFNISSELDLLHKFCSEIFTDNVLFSDISLEDFERLYKPLLPLLDYELIDFVLDKEEVVGLFFAVKNHFNPQQVIVKTIARKPKDKYKGLANIMASHFYQKAMKMGFTHMLHAYFHVTNKSSKVSSNYGGKLHQQHVLLKLDI